MFSSLTDTLFAVKLNSFDLQRMLGHFNEQYQEYLQKSGGLAMPVDGASAANDAAVLLGENDDEHQYPGYKIAMNNPVLIDHLEKFFHLHHVACIREVREDDHTISLIISKASLEEAGLTNKDEGEYLFSLHQKFQDCLEKHESMRQEVIRSSM